MNRKFILISLAIMLSAAAFSQQTKSLEFIWKGKYDNAQKAIEKGLSKNQDDVEFNFYKAYLLFQREYEGYDPVEAYKCLQTCEAYYPQLDEKTKEKLNTVPINMDIFNNYTDTICRYALKDAIRANTYEAYQNYLFFYRKASEDYRSEAKMYRNIEAYKLTIQKNTEEDYAAFIRTYPDAQQVPDATRRRDEKGLEKATAANTVEAYEEFLSKYPTSELANEAQEKVYTIALNNAERENTAAALKRYMEKYPKSSQYYKAEMMYEEKLYNEETADGNCSSYIRFVKRHPESKWKSMAITSAMQCAGDNAEIIKYCYKNLDGDKKNQAIKLYYNLVASDGEMVSLKAFYDELTESQRNLIRDKYVADSALAVKGEKLKIHNGYNAKKSAAAYDEYIKEAAPREKAFVALQKMIQSDIESKNWSNATVTVLKYKDYWKDKPQKINALLEILEQKNQSVTVEALSETINTSGNEYNPILSADGSTLYFCGEGRSNSKSGEDVFYSETSADGWTEAQLIGEVSTKSNDYPQCVNASGNTMYIFRNGRLYFSKKAGATWGKPQKMSSNVNSCNWQGDAFISRDGKAFFFAAKRNDMLNFFNDADFDGLVYHGKVDENQTDIYVCTVDENGEWGKPINLGASINTIFTERTPFLHSDNKHLYFASDGRGGLGGLDMYVSTRLSDDCWDCWSEPINLGKEINTASDDFGYKISGDGTKAYFSKSNAPKGKKGNLDIYVITLPENLQPKNIK
ncbi:MAG: PD40 domain-containing protein [Bacteroidales bacterium]|nr:PD40 domain-containing protein [Bacteroidales bacterium]